MKCVKCKKLILNIFLFGIIILSAINFISAYNWDFSNSSNYIYNTSEIIVSGGNAYLNGTNIAPIYAWWHLNENTGTNVNDSSGNNRNGVMLGNPLWVAGKLNSALQFNGLNNYVDFGNSTANFERTQAFSVELWFKTSNTGQQILLSKMKSTGNYEGWEIYYEGTSTNNIVFDLSNIATTNMIRVYCSPSVVADNNWHHIVVTYDGSSNSTGVKFYFDGVSKTTGVTYNTLTGSILTSTPFQLSGRGNGAIGVVGLLDEVIIYNSVLTSDKVTSRYNLGNGTEIAVGDYATGYYTIQPKSNFSYSANLMNFIETATKTSSAIQYSILNNGTWKYWNGASWIISNGSWTQSNPASEINSHLNTLGSSGNFSFKAVLHSTDGIYTPYLDNINISECSENWIANYTNCNILDNRTKIYYDSNNCGTTINLPIDNGTIEYCDFCTPNWICNLFDNTCDISPFPSQLNCLQINDTLNPTCCALTNKTSDCSANLSFYNKICGEMREVLIVPSYPYVDFNVSYPIQYKILINNVSTNIGIISMNITEINNTSSFFNFTWDSSSQSYKLTLIFTEEGDYPFKIFAYYPYHHDFTGTFIVRKPYYVEYCGYKEKDLTIYKNNFAYLIAEFTSSKKYYNMNLEQFITPFEMGILGFQSTYKTPVFHTPYTDGCGTFKLYEPNEEYAIRLIDGIVDFDTTFSVPNVTKSYGTNIYFGKYYLNGSDTSYRILLTAKDINQYFWLLNWIYIILIGLALIGSIFLFFIIPEKPTLSLIFGLGFIAMMTLIRIVLWFWIGQ